MCILQADFQALSLFFRSSKLEKTFVRLGEHFNNIRPLQVLHLGCVFRYCIIVAVFTLKAETFVLDWVCIPTYTSTELKKTERKPEFLKRFAKVDTLKKDAFHKRSYPDWVNTSIEPFQHNCAAQVFVSVPIMVVLSFFLSFSWYAGMVHLNDTQ